MSPGRRSLAAQQRCALLLLALFALALAACAAPTLPPPAETPPAPISWAGHRWLVHDPGTIVASVPALPPLLPAAPAPPTAPAALTPWAEPASGVMRLALQAIAAERNDPLHAARALMLHGVALNDALTVAGAAHTQGMALSEHALIAETARRVFAHTHPRYAAALQAELETATWAGVWQGTATVAGVINGRLLGAAVADTVIAWAAADGSGDAPLEYPLPAPAPGVWQPTPPAYEAPQDPAWHRVQTVAIGAPARLRAPAPPDWDSRAMQAQIADFLQVQAGLTAEQQALAETWDGGAGTITPPGMWVAIARQQIGNRQLATAEAAGIYAALGVALHDAAIACWESKYHYMLVRPVTVIQEQRPGWLPLLKTPPHPSYPSGHASMSGAASGVLAAAFPSEAGLFQEQADAAARSRVYGGIHWPMDGAAGLQQGAAVAAAVLAQLGEP